ncbi:MAG TPA: C1 family peptidase [Candidatus Hydrogenedentes bacterium]|nr:C1 family peptidase [Candidatus Hydrogenedentota bacterium]
MPQTHLLSDLTELRTDFVQKINDLWLSTVEDVAGIIRLAEINPDISHQMILSLLATELSVPTEIAQRDFINPIRKSIPDHEWYAMAKLEEPLPIGLLDDLTPLDSDIFLSPSSTPSSDELPVRINLTENYPELFLGIRNQGQRGTCVAFAATALHEYILGRAKGEPAPHLSEEFLYWASRNVQLKDLPNTCHQCGTIIPSALKAIMELGQCTNQTIPYQSDHRPCNVKLFDSDIEDPLNSCIHDNSSNKKSFLASGLIPPIVMKNAQLYKLEDWEIVEITDIVEMKRTLFEGFPIIVGVKVFLSWYSPSSRHRGRINIPFRLEIDNFGYQMGGHAMLLVGYENDVSNQTMRTPGGGYFLVRNSWGKSWGDESLKGLSPGYGMLPYGYFSKGLYRAYTLKPKNDYNKLQK